MSAPLRIGFASIYSWRPHVEQLYFLANLARQAEQECFFLTCDADLPTCYTRELRNIRPDWQECIACRLGGMRSFTAKNVSAIGNLPGREFEIPAELPNWALSSASTLGRFESDADFASDDFQQLADKLVPAVRKAYAAARQWIDLNRLDAVCVFNGRMDATRAIFEAARDAGIRVISVERPWFGDGIQLQPEETCLGLRSINTMVQEWSARPLTQVQAMQAAARAAARFTKTNVKEWRAYNMQAKAAAWPIDSPRHKILLLPGSGNEIWGHPDWASKWPEYTAAYDAVMNHLDLSPADVLLRCHPNWGENIGKNDGNRPEHYYTTWALARGIKVIPSRDTTSTLSLIEQCDAVVLASGSAALEAGLLGKQVISTAPSFYQSANFRSDASSPERLTHLRLHSTLEVREQAAQSRHIRQMTLRFAYTMSHRMPQYVEFVQAQSSYRYNYPPGADPQRLLNLIKTGVLQADDASYADDTEGEEAVMALIEAGRWNELAVAGADKAVNVAIEASKPYKPIRRRWMFRPIDSLRSRMPMGDR